MKAHVLTTTRSAWDASEARRYPCPISRPSSLSESTWFLGHPRVCNQYRLSTTRFSSPPAGATTVAAPGTPAAAGLLVQTRLACPYLERRGRDLNPRTQLPRSIH